MVPRRAAAASLQLGLGRSGTLAAAAVMNESLDGSHKHRQLADHQRAQFLVGETLDVTRVGAEPRIRVITRMRSQCALSHRP